MINRRDVMRSARVAGEVMRYHTWPTITQQTVAAHTWHVMRIWWQLFGPMSPEVSTYLLWDDAGELGPGDLPFPVKSHNPHLRQQVKFLEEESLLRIGGPSLGGLKLTSDDKCRAKACDLLEMYEYGQHELLLGNQFAWPIIVDIRASVMNLPLRSEDASKVQQHLTKVDTLFSKNDVDSLAVATPGV